jgi:hypothetical protein
MKEMEQLISFMTIWNDITSSRWPLNDQCFNDIFKPNIELANLSYCIVLYHTVPFFWYEKAISIMPGRGALLHKACIKCPYYPYGMARPIERS